MMKIQILELIEGAKQAEGLAVIIDVFRAFTTECYAFDRGALLCYPVGELEEAFALKKEDPSRILMGERGGAKVEGCDLGNSPWDAVNTDFDGKEMIHSTSAGTQGIVNAAKAGAQEILTGSLVNAKAVASYILAKRPDTVSIIAMGKAGIESVPEDLIAAHYIRALLKGEDFPLEEEIERYEGPVLLIHGDADETVPFEYAEKALKLYKNAKLIPIHGDDHCFTRHLNEMADALRAFFKEECK